MSIYFRYYILSIEMLILHYVESFIFHFNGKIHIHHF